MKVYLNQHGLVPSRVTKKPEGCKCRDIFTLKRRALPVALTLCDTQYSIHLHATAVKPTSKWSVVDEQTQGYAPYAGRGFGIHLSRKLQSLRGVCRIPSIETVTSLLSQKYTNLAFDSAMPRRST